MSAAQIQQQVDRLARIYGQSVLIEDTLQRPVWWSTVGAVDAIREKTILYRVVDDPAADVVSQYKLREATEPVRTPAIDELGMWARWCIPIRKDESLYGFLWLLDPEEKIAKSELGPLLDCALSAGQALHELEQQNYSHNNRDELLSKLVSVEDSEALRALCELEDISPNSFVLVNIPPDPTGWVFDQRLSVHIVDPFSIENRTSGSAQPLEQLHLVVRRAEMVHRAIRAGAVLSEISWNHLGAWRLVVEAPDDLFPTKLHRGIAVLLEAENKDLLATARVVLDNGGDVSASAKQMFVHRTTLYYRLDRIQDLIGIDIRTDAKRIDLQLAIWLAAYRSVTP